MKNKKIFISLISSFFITLVGCNNKVINKDIFDNTDLSSTQTKGCKKHKYKDVNSEKDNKHYSQCTICGHKTELVDHLFEEDNTKLPIEPTCTEKGYTFKTCSCGAIEKESVKPTGHNISKQIIEQNTCLKGGSERYICTNVGCTYEYFEQTEPLGHLFGTKTIVEKTNYATIKYDKCARNDCGITRIHWDPTQVTAYCKEYEYYYEKKWSNGNSQGFYEAAYEDHFSDKWIEFFGRPIHNAAPIDDEKDGGYYSIAQPVYDETVEGSFFEYKIYLTKPINGYNLVADIAPSKKMPSTCKIFSNAEGDWTPGLKKVGDEVVRYENRYVVTIDGEELDQDLTKSCNELPSGRKWYTFPLAKELNLDAGEHTIRISMGGGYISTIYGFGLQSHQ